MQKNTRSVLLLLLIVGLLILTGCTSIRNKGSSQLTVQVTDSSFEPTSLVVPAGENITISLENLGSVDHQWMLLSRPVEAPFTGVDFNNVIFSLSVAPGVTASSNFPSPAAAGEYQFISTQAGRPEDGLAGTLVVVQP